MSVRIPSTKLPHSAGNRKPEPSSSTFRLPPKSGKSPDGKTSSAKQSAGIPPENKRKAAHTMKTPPSKPAKPNPSAEPPQDDQSRALRILLQPEAMAAMTSCMALPQIGGQPFDPHAFCEELKHITRAVADGDISHLERLAVSQAVTLNFIFNRLSTAALDKLNQPEFDSLLRLAFRAQSQSARTMETYAALKNPAVFTKQLNVANQQVVNNGPISAPSIPPPALPESTPIVRLAESKILTPAHERMD